MTLDTRPLTERVDRPGLRRFRRSLPDAVRPPWPGIVARAVLIIGFPSALLAMWLTLIDGSLVDDGAFDWALAGILLPYVVIPIVGLVLLVRALRRRAGVRQYRLHLFAEANGFSYRAHAAAPPLPGIIFTRPGQSSAFVTDLVRMHPTLPAEVGNHTCVLGSGKNSSTYRWGYVAMRLPVMLPHIVLDARGNNSLRRPALPIAFERGQRLSLEGDFDQHFTLYCPEGYETDALYLFSPDVMARFIDTAARLDVEIVDDHLFLYAPGRLSTLDPAAWSELVATIELLSQRLERWGRWRDDRMPVGGAGAIRSFSDWSPQASDLARDRGVARQGRRLSVRKDWWWVLGAAFALFGLYNIVADIVAGFQ